MKTPIRCFHYPEFVSFGSTAMNAVNFTKKKPHLPGKFVSQSIDRIIEDLNKFVENHPDNPTSMKIRRSTMKKNTNFA